jgi:hypothetical protein
MRCFARRKGPKSLASPRPFVRPQVVLVASPNTLVNQAFRPQGLDILCGVPGVSLLPLRSMQPIVPTPLPHVPGVARPEASQERANWSWHRLVGRTQRPHLRQMTRSYGGFSRENRATDLICSSCKVAPTHEPGPRPSRRGLCQNRPKEDSMVEPSD